jgi:hypothetical protein
VAVAAAAVVEMVISLPVAMEAVPLLMHYLYYYHRFQDYY